MYSFYELFACYAKHLERFFSTTEDPALYASEFHELLVNWVIGGAEEAHHSSRWNSLMSGDQIEAMVHPLVEAERECFREHDLRHILHRLNFPSSIYSPVFDDHPLETEIYQHCCPRSDEDDR